MEKEQIPSITEALRGFRMNIIVRGAGSLAGTPKLVVFGFLVVPDDTARQIMDATGGKDAHVILGANAYDSLSKIQPDTWNKSVEDILEGGIPAFRG